MNRQLNTIARATMTGCLMMLVNASVTAQECGEYEVTVIAGFQCGDHLAAVAPQAISETGDVVGYVSCNFSQSAFLWTPKEGLQLIPMPDGTSKSHALAISGSKIVGLYTIPGNGFGHQGFLYDYETDEFTSLGTLKGGNWSEAHDINSSGQITGFWGNNIVGPWQAFLWENGEMIDLGPSIGGANSRAFGINENGAITGWWQKIENGERIAFLWEDGKATSLGPIPGGFTSEGRAINSMLQIVGRGKVEGDEVTLIRAFLWENSQFMDLGTLPGFDRCAAIDINDCSTVIGGCDQSDNPSNDQLFVWSQGEMVNLSDLLPDNSGVNIAAISAINNNGQISAQAHSVKLDATVGVVLTPSGGFFGDLDGDCTINVSDLLILLASWGPCEGCVSCAADLDGNDIVSVSDLLLLFSNWG